MSLKVATPNAHATNALLAPHKLRTSTMAPLTYTVHEIDDSYMDNLSDSQDFRNIVTRLPKDPFVVRDVTETIGAVETVIIIGSVVNHDGVEITRGSDYWSHYVIETFDENGYLASQQVITHRVANVSRVPYDIPYEYDVTNRYFSRRFRETLEVEYIDYVRESDVTPDMTVLRTTNNHGVRTCEVLKTYPQTFDKLMYGHQVPRRPEIVAMAHYLVGLFADLPGKTSEMVDAEIDDFGTGVPAFASGIPLPRLPSHEIELIKDRIDTYLSEPIPSYARFLNYIALVGGKIDGKETCTIFKILSRSPRGLYRVLDLNTNQSFTLDIPLSLQKSWVVRGMTAILGSNISLRRF